MEHDPFALIHTAVRKDGSIVIPADSVMAMGLNPGARVHVRVTGEALSERVLELGVTEQEVDALSAMQLESRDNVLRFLAVEGSLRNKSGFRSRVRAWRR